MAKAWWRDSDYELFDRLTRERDEALARCETLRALADEAAYEQGLAQRRMMDAQRERDEARAEVERLRTALLEVQTSESAPAWFADGFHDGWKAGAEAMREACIGYAHKIGFHGLTVDIRALPIPEEP